MYEMRLVKIGAVVSWDVLEPIVVLCVTMHNWNLYVIEIRSFSINIIWAFHICILMHDKLPIRVIIVVKSVVIHVEKHLEFLDPILG